MTKSEVLVEQLLAEGYVAIVLSKSSSDAIRRYANDLGFLDGAAKVYCHHVTLSMAPDDYSIGSHRKLQVTHYGKIEGRVSALRVLGAQDSKNAVPHITLATFGNAKPVESNQITNWVKIEPFAVDGTIELCESIVIIDARIHQ